MEEKEQKYLTRMEQDGISFMIEITQDESDEMIALMNEDPSLATRELDLLTMARERLKQKKSAPSTAEVNSTEGENPFATVIDGADNVWMGSVSLCRSRNRMARLWHHIRARLMLWKLDLRIFLSDKLWRH